MIFASGYYPVPKDQPAHVQNFVQDAIDVYKSDGLDGSEEHLRHRGKLRAACGSFRCWMRMASMLSTDRTPMWWDSMPQKCHFGTWTGIRLSRSYLRQRKKAYGSAPLGPGRQWAAEPEKFISGWLSTTVTSLRLLTSTHCRMCGLKTG